MTEYSTIEKENDFQIKDFMLVQRVIKKINSILDLKDLLEQIIEDASKTLGFTKCGVLLYDSIANQLELVAVTGWDDKTINVGDKFNPGEGIVWRSFYKNKIIYYPDISEYPDELPCDFKSQSHVDFPLVSKGKVFGIINAQHTERDGFSEHDINVLKTLAGHVSIAIQNALLFEEEKREKEIILRDIKEASIIQKNLFPKNSPEIKDFHVTGMCEPCIEVGGDWFDYIELPSGKTGVVLADVAGKGLAASLLMASARTIIRMISLQEESPAKVLKKVNDILTIDLPVNRFITLIYGVIDPVSKVITIANAGHHLPVISFDNKVSFLSMESGLPLGIKEHNYKEYNFSMKSGDKIFLYSDGVSEAMNTKKEMFEEHRLLQSLRKPLSTVNTLYNDVKTFTGNIPLSDDLTIVMIEAT
ncbi:MAG: GAF domain-containing SpoIIE family protein phosphatase [Ignavibacteriaceae bacterium]|nr:GAF domain-containing SpoIIE family protein phosphatase [Ignavibacteriaceae bacterium]